MSQPDVILRAVCAHVTQGHARLSSLVVAPAGSGWFCKVPLGIHYCLGSINVDRTFRFVRTFTE
jgi:hypothetical protein